MLDRLDAVLNHAVAERMIADVPLGAFLSGGIDSSLIVAMMPSQSAKPVQTFTIGCDEGFYDEAAAARRVAGHRGTDHTDFVITASPAPEPIPVLARGYADTFPAHSATPPTHTPK